MKWAQNSKKRFWLKFLVIATVVLVVPPFLGIAGTLFGMIGAFDELSSGGANPARLSSDISFALITTVIGILVSLIGFFGVMISVIGLLRADRPEPMALPSENTAHR